MINSLMLNFSKNIALGVTSTLLTLASGSLAQALSFTVIADGLDAPRGLTFAPDGKLYVAEAGSGGNGACIPSPNIPGAILCYGATGAISVIENNSFRRVITGLPSIASLGSTAIPDGSDASGPHDLLFDNSGNPFVITGLASAPENRDNLLGVSDFGQILAIQNFNNNPRWSQFADLAMYENDNNPDGDNGPGGINTNPFYMTLQGNNILAIDAGGNDLLSVDLNNGNISTEAVFPARNVSNPLGGPDISMQSVPTSVAIGPDDTIYVSELTGSPFPQNQARIYTVENKTPQVYLDGFTNIIDFALADNGYLYVLEDNTHSILSQDPTSALIEVKPNGDRRTLLSDGLISPTAIAIDEENFIYISNNAFLSGIGQVIKFDPQSVPEPGFFMSLISLGIIGLNSKLTRKS